MSQSVPIPQPAPRWSDRPQLGEGVRSLDRVVRVPADHPAGICLGGDDGRTLYITSARVGLSAPGPFDGAVFEVRVAVPGLPTAPYRPEWV
jgi:sugar lactone lactonase YvrE